MNQQVALLVFLGLTVAVVHAETPAVTFSPERFRSHVEFLADDLLEGRETGTRGYDIAARYVASQFRAYGLEPGGHDGSWFQPVTLQRTTRAGNSSLTISGPGGDRQFAHADNVLLGVSPHETSLDVSAPLVFVGFGLEDKRLGLDDYRGLDVKGAIVVALRGFPKGLPSEEGAHVNARKARMAQRHGAIGMFIVGTRESEKAFPWKRSLESAHDPDFTWVGTDGKPHDEAPAIRAYARLNGPAADALFAGSKRTREAIREEADRPEGMPRGFALKTRARLQSAATWSRLSSANVIAILRGGDAAMADDYVTLLAHLDHLGIKDGKIHNGALDNAAGIATLLEVARAAATGPRPKRSMLFLASTGEEKGLLGADYFARNPTVPIGRIVGNVGLDMPLLLYPFTDVIAFGANHSSLGKMVSEAVAPMNLELSPDPMPEQGVFTRSDHYALVKRGVPAVFLVTGMANGGKQVWADFLGGNYHRPGDNLSQSIDWTAGARFAEANYRITRGMADSKTPPLWYSGDYFGDSLAPGAARATR
jgi:hypothetical protein